MNDAFGDVCDGDDDDDDAYGDEVRGDLAYVVGRDEGDGWDGEEEEDDADWNVKSQRRTNTTQRVQRSRKVYSYKIFYKNC